MNSNYVRETAKAEARKSIQAARQEARWAEYELATTLCLNCYGLGHRRTQCRQQGIIACSHCFVLNRFTQSCNCRQKEDTHAITPGQVFRLAGDKKNRCSTLMSKCFLKPLKRKFQLAKLTVL